MLLAVEKTSIKQGSEPADDTGADMTRYIVASVLAGSSTTVALLTFTYLEGPNPVESDWLDIRWIALLLYFAFLAIEIQRQRASVRKSAWLIFLLPIAFTIAWLSVSIPALIFFHVRLGRPL